MNELSARRKSVLAGLFALLVGAVLAGSITLIDLTLVHRTQADSGIEVPAIMDYATAPVISQANPAANAVSQPADAPSASAAPAGPSPEATAVTDLVNQARAGGNCPALRLDAQLTAAAQGHATDMARRGFLSDTTPEGITFAERILDAGYAKPGAENIAKGPATAQAAVDGWLNSANNRSVILDCRLTAIGVGFDPNGPSWVQTFGF